VAVIFVILVSTSTMVLECHDQSEQMKDLLKIFDLVFVVVFLLEFLLKFLGLRWYYFRDLWNLFDFMIVAGSVAGEDHHSWASFGDLRVQAPQIILSLS